MDYQHKAEALAGLCELTVRYREQQWRIARVEPWYVQQKIDVKKAGACSIQGKCGNGLTPEAAILDHWKVLVDELAVDEYLIIESGTDRRRAVKWNGFMWADYPEPELTKAA